MEYVEFVTSGVAREVSEREQFKGNSIRILGIDNWGGGTHSI